MTSYVMNARPPHTVPDPRKAVSNNDEYDPRKWGSWHEWEASKTTALPPPCAPMPASITAWSVASNNTRMHKAAYNGDVSAVMKYIAAGDDINARNSAGSTPLHSAFYFPYGNGMCDSRFWSDGRGAKANWLRAANKFAVAQLLVDNGATTSIKDKYRNTPLDIAPSMSMLAKTGHLAAMEWLSELDGTRWNPTEVDTRGRTPLHAAAYCGAKWKESRKLPTLVVTNKCLAADWLVDKGCAPDQRDSSGNSARSICTAVYRGVPGYEHKAAAPGPIYASMGRTLDDASARGARARLDAKLAERRAGRR